MIDLRQASAWQMLPKHYAAIKDAHLPMKSTAEERKKVAETFKADPRDILERLGIMAEVEGAA